MNHEASGTLPAVPEDPIHLVEKSKEDKIDVEQCEAGQTSEASDVHLPEEPQQRPKSWGELSQSYIENVTGAVAGAVQTTLSSTYHTVKEVGKV